MIGPAGTDWDEISNDVEDQRFGDAIGVEIDVARDVKLLSQQAWLDGSMAREKSEHR